MATENIIMKLVSQVISRQESHEQVRVLSHQSSDIVKKQGLPNDLIQRIKSTEFFRPVWTEIDRMLDPKNFIGLCPEQVVPYCGDEDGEAKQALRPYKKYIEQAKAAELIV
jgi:adenylosuccinate lyase